MTTTKQNNIMYTINKKFGIGQVEEISNGMVTVYFADEDVTKELVQAYTTIYSTLEEAERALNPELTEEDMNNIAASIAQENQIMADGTRAQHMLEAYHIEESKKLMKNI
jgi:hypothetical protein